jgi:hypothetical protein
LFIQEEKNFDLFFSVGEMIQVNHRIIEDVVVVLFCSLSSLIYLTWSYNTQIFDTASIFNL